jgi:hypothetical protein
MGRLGKSRDRLHNPRGEGERARKRANQQDQLRLAERASQNRYAVINREICSRHVVWGPYEHVVCAASQKRLPVAMYHASAFRSRACHRSHVCVFVLAWLNVGELPRFDNQLQHLAALSLHLVDLARAELLEFADIGRELYEYLPRFTFESISTSWPSIARKEIVLNPFLGNANCFQDFIR